ncbi:MAG: sialate O-acetylesterase [Porphyromonadaceae bacterium]|nr:sialate O-acetylesterase [Porphyromonadaceae bacterium]
MKSVILVCLLFASTIVFSQKQKYSNFYYQRATLFEQLPIGKKDVVFVGNSITNGAEWFELFNNKYIKNRGISGDTAEGVLDRIEVITEGKPKKIFLMIGVNDLIRGKSPDSVVITIEKIVLKIKQDTPKTKLYIQSVLPTNRNFKENVVAQGSVRGMNERLMKIATEHQVFYIDLFSHFKAEHNDAINPKYSNDGLHLLGDGYLLWKKLITKYVK